jgi:hypothetical protein
VCTSCGCCASWANIEDGWYDQRVCNNFYVLGWGDLGGSHPATRDKYAYADHHFQARVVLPAVLQEFVVKRWNKSCEGPVAGFGADDPDVGICKPEEGVGYDDSVEQKQDYVPDLTPTSPPLQPCPFPGSGEVLTGSKTDRCAVAPGGVQSKPKPENKLLTGPQVFAALAALGAGYAGVRYGKDIWRRLRRR